MLKTQNKPATNPTLIRQIRGMLAYWREETKELNNETVVMLEAERQNLLRAVEAGLLFPECAVETASILHQTFPFIEQWAYWQEWIPLLKRCLDNNPNIPIANQILLMARLGQAYRLDRKLERAVAIHLEAEQLAKMTGETALIGRIKHDLLEDYFHSREYEKAKVCGHSAIDLLETHGTEPILLANCYKMLGLVYLEGGDADIGEKYSRTAVELWQKLDDPLYFARALSDLVRPLLAQKKYDQALECLKEAAVLLGPTIYELDKCIIQINLGTVYAAQKEWTKAEAAFHQANSPYLRRSVYLLRKARVKNNLGYVLFHQGRYETAEEYLRQSATIWEHVQDELEAANTLSTLADVLAVQDKYQPALELYEKVVTIFRKFPDNLRAQRLRIEYEDVLDNFKQQNSQPA